VTEQRSLSVVETEWVAPEDLLAGDVLANPHLGTMPPAVVTEVIPTPLLGGGATIRYEHPDAAASLDGIARFSSWCRPSEKLEILRRDR
jgi:hypothetical protein